MPTRLAPLVLAMAAVAAGCSSAASPGADRAVTSTSVAATTATTAPPAPSTSTPSTSVPPPSSTPPSTVYRPTNPQPSPDAAAAALIEDWAAGTRAGATTLATPAAIDALFAQTYQPGGLQSRGCTDAGTSPGTCTYADRNSGSLYQFDVSKGASAWYVTSVTVES